jgi:hypothetical protein
VTVSWRSGSALSACSGSTEYGDDYDALEADIDASVDVIESDIEATEELFEEDGLL